MARVDNKGFVRGTAGSVIYRKYRNKNIIQGKPRKHEQTAGTIRASSEFGLASSTAAVIRKAFQSSYVHHDGEAVSRSTRHVYRGLLRSLSGSAGRRDLHDADLSSITGMDFNNNSPLAKVLQSNYRVERDDQGRISVFMGAVDAAKDIRLPAALKASVSKYRIRFTLIGFNFRKEYYEYLEVKDVELRKYGQLPAQEIRFEVQPEQEQLLLLSMSLLMYKETRMDEGYVLLNSKEFSPAALIAAYAAEAPGEYPEKEVNLVLREEQQGRAERICGMVYQGNTLIRELARRIKAKGKDEVKAKGKIKAAKAAEQPPEVRVPPKSKGRNKPAEAGQDTSGIPQGERVFFGQRGTSA